MSTEKTSNGIAYTSQAISYNGADFVLYPGPHHTEEDIKKAKEELFRSRDVVRIALASDSDRDGLFIKEVFMCPAVVPLRWFQININHQLIRSERLKGTTPEEYVTRYVLPVIEQTHAENLQKFGESIYKM